MCRPIRYVHGMAATRQADHATITPAKYDHGAECVGAAHRRKRIGPATSRSGAGRKMLIGACASGPATALASGIPADGEKGNGSSPKTGRRMARFFRCHTTNITARWPIAGHPQLQTVAACMIAEVEPQPG